MSTEKLSHTTDLFILSDFLEREEDLGEVFKQLAARGVKGHAVQILDPAEETLPYEGRIEFLDLEGGPSFTAERAETLRALYQKRLQAHKSALMMHAKSARWTLFLHHTHHVATPLLHTLHRHLSNRGPSTRAKTPERANSWTENETESLVSAWNFRE